MPKQEEINMAEDLPAPKSRKEEYLATAAGMTGIQLPEPASREEIYLDAIAQGGGGGGGGSDITVVQTTGQSTTDVMSQKAVTDMIFNEGQKGKIQIGERASASIPGNGTGIAIGVDASATLPGNIAIGDAASSTGSRGTAIGWNANVNKINGVALGRQATAAGDNSVAVGWNAYASEKGQFDISTGSNVTAGYNNTNYRVLSGVHDPRVAHDAATKGYVDNAVAGAGGSDGARTLKQSDYNWPADNPDGVAMWLMPVGYYRASDEEPVKAYITSTFSYTVNAKNFAVMVAYKDSGVELVQWHYSYDSVAPTYANIYIVNPTTGAQTYRFTLRAGIINYLTSTSTTIPLAAAQGKVLNDKFGGMQLVSITQTAYDALTTKDPNTLYIITGA